MTAKKSSGLKVPSGQRYTVSRQETRNGTDVSAPKTYEADEDVDLDLDVGHQLVIRADAAPEG